MGMIRIYLDQNMWIGLKNTATGSANSERFARLPEACMEAVAAERCRFVLSYSHYEETHRRPRLAERTALAQIMLGLSHAQTMTLPEVIVRHEVRAALHDLLDLDVDLPAFDPFGWGLDHAIGHPIIADAVAASSIPSAFHETAIAQLQLGALVGADRDTPRLPDDHPLHQRSNNRAYAAQRTELRSRMQGWSRDRVRADNFTLASEFVELIPIIDEVAAPLGRSSADVIALGRAGLDRFMSLLPMESIVSHLHRTALLTDREWQPNDHNDVVYLGAAAAYCDAVVGEKHWTSKLKDQRCPTRSGFIGSSPEDLRQLLQQLV